ncbi:glycosyltransferase family 2 protein [Agrobacterium rubi]|uniref:chitin synthase n=1 Tax=Agrobacterium rubi TaxID=28099 RepID=A0AAE7UR95_9HYPH|nr:glycosyltransferase family 2 protein [Agrobacterium rubi]MCL6652677.1 hypothetical protein [Agrobacterium rubi]NTE87453.1 hypothetical protein [Agrobacterium rubi]NTF03307.1 hypothetical protein [Agrobacterium rubi]NTF09776.1 hypothetical protein [Agrobacterium rubi]NTF22047.1 hypothetical protein [Agrobacterium rubi]
MNLIAHPLSTTAFPLPDSERETRRTRRDFYETNTILLDTPNTVTAEVLVCLTLFNEPVEAMNLTLAGLVRNQLTLRSARAENPLELKICIMLDGCGSIDPDTSRLLQTFGLNPDRGQDRKEASNRLLLQCSELKPSFMLEQMGDRQTEVEDDSVMTLFLGTKQDNAGKIDTHAWFFWGVGSQLTANHAMQIDVGSVPRDDCLLRLLEHMEREPQCGAVTTHILAPSTDGFNMSLNWQYADYLWEKIVDWPVGNLCGYLEVVPGQCSMVRWSSFCGTADPKDDIPPVDHYLRGLAPQGLLERNLFLAEDRVLGFELVKRKGVGCTVRYAPDAVLDTDACQTFSELMRQRRRWINSTIAARINSLRQMPGILVDGAVPVPRKMSISLSLAWGLMQLVMQFLMPTFIAVLCGMAGAQIATWIAITTPPETVGRWSAATFLAFWVVLLWLGRQVSVNTAAGSHIHIAAVSVLGAIIAVGYVAIMPGTPPLSFAFQIGALALLSLAVILPARETTRYWGRWMPLYLLLLPTMALFLTSYSVANFSDVSWGTKGLLASGTSKADERRWSRL